MIKYTQLNEVNGEYFAQAIEIYNIAFPDNEKLPITVLEENIKQKKLKLFIGDENSQVVFMAILCPLLYTDFILLGYVATDENYRGKGIGKNFMEYLALELKQQQKFLLLEVENPLKGDNQETKQRRVNFYQRLGAKTLQNIHYLLPKLSEKKAPEMILMLYPDYPQSWINGSLVKKLIHSLYKDFYQQPKHYNINFLCDKIPDKINLI